MIQLAVDDSEGQGAKASSVLQAVRFGLGLEPRAKGSRSHDHSKSIGLAALSSFWLRLTGTGGSDMLRHSAGQKQMSVHSWLVTAIGEAM